MLQMVHNAYIYMYFLLYLLLHVHLRQKNHSKQEFTCTIVMLLVQQDDWLIVKRYFPLDTQHI